jgi:membrane protein implicated in regulation of membrane protease activity
MDLDPGALDVDIDGTHLDSSEVLGTGEIHLSPVSPMIISGFVTVFGASGIIANSIIGEKVHPILIALIALAAGCVGAALIWIILNAIMKAVSGSSEAKVASLIGMEAEVITPIRGSSMGEIAYICRGSRYNAPARCLDKSDIERNGIVKIVKIVGTTYFVQELKDDEPIVEQSIKPEEKPPDES